jgi:hypothetical protein
METCPFLTAKARGEPVVCNFPAASSSWYCVTVGACGDPIFFQAV